MHFRLVIALCLLAMPCLPLQAAPKPVAPPQAQPWLTTAVRTRADVLAQLAPKAAQPPYDKILPLLTQAQAELAQTDPAKKRIAVGHAYDDALLVLTKTDDHALAARLFDGFLLPALPFAQPDPSFYDSRRHLLKAAVGAYQQAGQEDRQLAALRLLRRDAGDDENLSDWVNLQFAAVYAHRGQYEPAMDALGAVKSPGMMAGTAYLPQLQQKQEELKQQQEERQQATKPIHSHSAVRAKRAPKRSITH